MNIKTTPKKAAKIAVGEAFETLKRAKEQVTSTGEYAPQKGEAPQNQEVQKKDSSSQKEAKVKEVRHFQAYQAELRDIGAQVAKEEQIKKQQEAVQTGEGDSLPKEPPPQISSVPSRGRGKFFGLRKKLSDLGKIVEVRKPPSG